jgi:glycosyltransferase involved in cell wall biosynthesis
MQSYQSISKIGFFSPLGGVGTTCGYGYAAVELIKAWQRLNIPVWSHDDEAPVIFNFGQPHFYDSFDGKLNIGYTPWESTGVPKSWVTKMNKMDEIWTPCNANAEWYRDAGVEVPIRVLPHGINREHFPIKGRLLGSRFNFLHVGEPTPRKGGAIVYRVFKDVFGDDPRFHLTLKGKPKFKIHGDNVTVIREHISQDELRELHEESHCMVYPTFGEGFGFIPFQAAASGMPTIVTDWSAPQDYMEFCTPLNVEKLVETTYEPHLGMWAKPDESHLAQLMLDVTQNHEERFQEAYAKAQRMDANWSWDAIAKQAVEYLAESLT